MARLNSGFWIQSYLHRLQLAEIPAFVVAKGDPESGAVLVKLNLLDGTARLYQRSYDLMAEKRIWMMIEEGEDARIDEQLGRHSRRDPDLWIVEVEDRAGRSLLDERGLSE